MLPATIDTLIINGFKHSDLRVLECYEPESGVNDDIYDLAASYFSLGFRYEEILTFLNVLHKKQISLRTLKRRLSEMRLYRRKHFSRIEDVVEFIETELNKSGQLHGYKWMHLRCLQNNLIVTQQVVRELLSLLDPVGVDVRKRNRLRRRQYDNKGPNYLWHVDSYDKLKPYGICINGCIDGFSRQIIWLKVGPTSNDPKVIGGYFLEAVKSIGGCPKTLRSDMGTENGIMERIQTTFHEVFAESMNRPCFLYGKSMHNQRIEAWWSILRKHNAQYWMNLFQTLIEDNLFDGSFLDKSLVQFCFIPLVQSDLDQICLEWSIHRIRKTRNAIAPAGRPSIMYAMPSLYGVTDYLVKIPSFAFEPFSSECTFIRTNCDEDFYKLCSILMGENNYLRSSDPYATIELYINLRSKLIPLLQ